VEEICLQPPNNPLKNGTKPEKNKTGKHMSSRDNILNNIRQNKPVFLPKPEVLVNQVPTENRGERFASSLALAGGSLVEFNSKKEMENHLSTSFSAAKDLRDREKWGDYTSCPPSSLDSIGTVILEAFFGVAENGAVWLNDASFPQRIIPFIAESLVITLPKKSLVNDMGEACKRLSLNETGFGLFIAGPSKTADIEQSLVYGAHGPKELVVLIY
jgi:L-lactate dehydrogenase complex protein LldG